MGGLRRDNMLILYGMGGRERLFIDGMGWFLASSLYTSYEAKYFKMNKKNRSENYFRFWKSYEVIMKQILRKRSALLCVACGAREHVSNSSYIYYHTNYVVDKIKHRLFQNKLCVIIQYHLPWCTCKFTLKVNIKVNIFGYI
jgi:hypothetical protein